MAAKPDKDNPGFEAINKLKSTDPPLFLSPNPDLSSFSRLASQHLFTSLKPHSPKSPFDQLLSDGFDAEQIWQQIDLQSQPLITSLKREVKRFEKDPALISRLFGKFEGNGVMEREFKGSREVGLEEVDEDFEGLSDEDEDEVGESEEDEDEDEEEEEDDESEEGEEELEDDEDGVPEVEDDFLKIKDLQKYLVREEKLEYGSEEQKGKKKKKKKKGSGNDDDEEEDESEEDEQDDELLMYGGGGAYEEESEDDIRYEDFYVPNKKTPVRKRKQIDKSDDSEMEDDNVHYSDGSEMEDEDDADEMEEENHEQNKGNLSTYEREHEKIQAKIKQMEAENLAPKDWTMQGEISASKRPIDSALEVNLDFEHNIRPPPVITEEVTASLEEIIKKRILEGHFDDVQRAPKLPSSAPKERKELDENKSKKGLAEIYEDEYAQQTGFASAPLSFNDELKKEANDLFKRLCLNLEVAVWHKLDHPNVTKFIGASMGTSNLKIPSNSSAGDADNSIPSRACCVVVEYLAGGTLKNFLIRNSRSKLAIKVVIQLALDLSRGLSYLHSKKIVHRDVKTENMLLDTSRTLKIADFGVARVEAQNPRDMTGETGTLGYMAPEVLDGKPYNRKCDVYSFGICLWEIYCCDMPYPDLSFADVSSAVVRQNLRPDIPRCCPPSLASIMRKCWDANPNKRPDMDEVVRLLEAIDTNKGGGMIPDDQVAQSCFCFGPCRGP